MVTQIEQVKKRDEASRSKKRWVAPDVTRLEFPKTAGGSTNTNYDGPYAVTS
jgi:hypothetical protein